MSGPSLLSRRRVDLEEWSITGAVNGSGTLTGYLAPGNYYLDSPTAAESLVTAIDTCLETTFSTGNFTCAYDLVTGKITTTCTNLAGVWTMTFNETSFRNWVGWGASGGWSGVAGGAQTSAEVCQGVIFAESERKGLKRRPKEYGVSIEKAIQGPPSIVSHGGTFRIPKWMHEFELDSFVASPLSSGTWNAGAGLTNRPWAWEDFFDHHASLSQAGQPFRVYDAGAALSAYEDEYFLVNAGKFDPEPRSEETWFYWVVPIEACSYRASG